MLLSRKGGKAQVTSCFRIVNSRTGDPSRENLFCGFMAVVCFLLLFTSRRSSSATMTAASGKTILRYCDAGLLGLARLEDPKDMNMHVWAK
jgi:hypothetical protein